MQTRAAFSEAAALVSIMYAAGFVEEDIAAAGTAAGDVQLVLKGRGKEAGILIV